MTKKPDAGLSLKGRFRLVNGGNPVELFPMPTDDDFGEDEFCLAPKLGEIGEALIESSPCFASLVESPIVYLWKRKGPEKPRRLLGKCQRPAGLLSYFARAHFVVWLAANNCKGLTRWQIEALVFHELKHARVDGDVAVSVPHDWEGFAEEIERYGLWKSDIVPIAEATHKAMQLPFPAAPCTDSERLREEYRRFVASVPPGGSVTISSEGEELTITDEDARRARGEQPNA